MPATYLMTWEPKTRRWTKQHNGKRLAISCRQLAKILRRPVPETKEGSYQAANEFWKSKQAELDGTNLPHPHADDITELERRRDWARSHGEHLEAEFCTWLLRQVKASRETPELELHRRGQALLQMAKHGFAKDGVSTSDEDFPVDAFDVETQIWNDRLSRHDTEPQPTDRTVGFQVRTYLANKLKYHQSGRISPSEYEQIHRCINVFGDWLGHETLIEHINADKWEGFCFFIEEWNGAVETKKKRIRHARKFINWLARKDLIQAPSNLHGEESRFRSEPKAIETMTVEEVQRLIENARGQLKLHLLLMANTGMLQKDISDLKPSEVDWDEGRITRKRSKTKKIENVPTVSYELWPLTFSLLKEYGCREGENVFLTRNGRPFLRDGIREDSARSRTDNIYTNYRRLKQRIGFNKPLKLLRNTSSSLLDNHPEFARYAGHFLGHAPDTVRDRHYITPSQEQFDRAVSWLGERYGFIPQT